MSLPVICGCLAWPNEMRRSFLGACKKAFSWSYGEISEEILSSELATVVTAHC